MSLVPSFGVAEIIVLAGLAGLAGQLVLIAAAVVAAIVTLRKGSK